MKVTKLNYYFNWRPIRKRHLTLPHLFVSSTNKQLFGEQKLKYTKKVFLKAKRSVPIQSCP